MFGPAQPQWENTGQGGITVQNGLLELHFVPAAVANVTFNIYRDGRLCAKEIKETNWVDPHSADYTHVVYFYSVEAVDAKTGNASHLTPSHFYPTTNSQWSIPAAAMENHGGKLADGRYFMDWGKSGDELRANHFIAKAGGHFAVRVEFSNGVGPVNTGITCAVKKLEVHETASGELVAAGYLVMPQSGDWRRFDWSSIVPAELKAGGDYSIRIFEDEYSRNMSYLAANGRYTALSGGGGDDYNFVNIASIQFQRVAD